MKFYSNNLLILSTIISCSYCMEAKEFSLTNYLNNNYEVNINNDTNKIQDFYSNTQSIGKYLKSKIIKVTDNSSIQFKTYNITEFDWKLFSYNIKHSASARANLQILLKEFSKNRKISNLEVLENIFYEYFNIADHHKYRLNRTQELIGIILYYYLDSIEHNNINDLQNIQNNLSSMFHKDKQFLNIFKKYHTANYSNLYLAELDKENYKYKILNGECTEELNSAIECVTEINLADILKHIIVSINIGEILFNRENLNASNKINDPLFITNGHCQCWFRSTLQLINSAIELYPPEMKYKLKSKPEYVLMDFLKYLKDDSLEAFQNKYQYDVIYYPEVKSFHKLFSEFKDKLPDYVKQVRNTDIDINKAERILYYLNKNKIVSNITIALPILAKLFPELNYLFPTEQLNKGWGILNKNIKGIIYNDLNTKTIFKDNKYIQLKYYFPPSVCDTTCKADFQSIPREYYNNLYIFMLDDNTYQEATLETQVQTHQYRIGLTKENTLVVYTLKGMHLANALYQNIDSGGTHFFAYSALDNTKHGWYFSESLGKYSNPRSAILPDILDVYKDGFFNNDFSGVIDAFMYRKITNNEILKYINEENIVK